MQQRSCFGAMAGAVVLAVVLLAGFNRHAVGQVVTSGRIRCPPRPSSSCPLDLDPDTSIIFVADPGRFSGTPESTYYLENLQEKRPIPRGIVTCLNGHVGVIMRQSVAVILTGIGPTSSALCVIDVMQKCGSRVRDVFFSGTSGWSPQLGGVLNNGSCSSPNTNGQITRLGDVSVSPISTNWDCRQASHMQTCEGTPNQCSFPQQIDGPSNSDLFGPCQFGIKRDEATYALADEVLMAARLRAGSFPKPNQDLQDLQMQYWSAMSNGTGLLYPLQLSAPPKIWSYRQAMEIDAWYFFSGLPWDMVARNYVAQTMNAAFNSTTAAQDNVIAVSAMEAVGLGHAMERYYELDTTRRRTPYVIVRGMSDFLHPPLVKAGSGEWRSGTLIQNFAEGYKYAIVTYSSAVLSTLQLRCERDQIASDFSRPSTAADVAGRHRPPRPGPVGPCTYSISY